MIDQIIRALGEISGRLNDYILVSAALEGIQIQAEEIKPSHAPGSALIVRIDMAGYETQALKLYLADVADNAEFIYGRKNLMNILASSGRAAKINNTFLIKDEDGFEFRAVLYDYLEGKNLRDHGILELDDLAYRDNPIYEDYLRCRETIEKLGFYFYFPEPDDFIYAKGRVVLTDFNKIIPLRYL